MVVPNLNFLQPYPIYNLMVHRHRTTASSSLSSLLQPYPIRTLHHAPRPTLTLGPGSVEEERRQLGRPTGPRPRRDAQSRCVPGRSRPGPAPAKPAPSPSCRWPHQRLLQARMYSRRGQTCSGPRIWVGSRRKLQFSAPSPVSTLSAQFQGLLLWSCCRRSRLFGGAVKRHPELLRERYQTAPRRQFPSSLWYLYTPTVMINPGARLPNF